MSLGSRDYLQQQDGFRPSSVPDWSVVAFPRLCVLIKCSSWSHREKRTSKSTTAHARHAMSGPMCSETSSDSECVSSRLTVMTPVNEAGYTGPPSGSITLKTIPSQDDYEMGRGRGVRTGSSVPNITDNEKIDHKVVCAVISGHTRHGIRIGQRERSSIYDIEELNGQCEEVYVGGSPSEVEFELQLTVQAPNQCGICRCAFAVLPAGSHDQAQDPLMEVGFDASAEEHLHFYISSSYFDSNSSYSVSLNWVLRPGMVRPVGANCELLPA